MKIREALEEIEAMKPGNPMGENYQILWLSRLDNLVYREIISKHEHAEPIEFNGYAENVDKEAELLVPAPYDAMYVMWLAGQIDLQDKEFGSYNNYMEQFSHWYDKFKAEYNRTNTPAVPQTNFF